MTSYPNGGSCTLSDSHRKMLFEESGISPEVAAERGYRTVTRRAELGEFPEWQRRLGLYVPMRSPRSATEGPHSEAQATRRPWWRRIFGVRG